MRLIDADALIFTHEIARSLDDGHNWNELCITADEIAEAPTIEPKRGEWIGTRIGHYPGYECSLCHYGVQPWNTTRYCPNCGCAMTKESE